MATKPIVGALPERSNSQALFDRACQVIPNGVYGHFNPAVLRPGEVYPHFAERAFGARFWDVDGNEYIDYMCAFGPMILGYANPTVDGAFRRQTAQADTCTLASPIMVELAEYLVDLVPAADWALFAKNGADATNLAVMVARAATGRDTIIAIEGGYHGSSAWMQAEGRPGVIATDHAQVVRIPWNDVPALEAALDEHSGGVAAFISSPYHHPVFQDNALPAEGYWTAVEALLKKHHVALILDDVRAGFRIDMGGSNEYFGFKPDLICFCKALANGYPIAALVGSDAMRQAATDVFQTGSFWFSAGPMAAALACLQEMERIDAPARILAIGRKLVDGLGEVAKHRGCELRATGMPSMPYLRLAHEDGIRFHQKVVGECVKRGVYLTHHHNHFLSTAHTDEDVQQTLEIFDQALAT